MFESYYLFVFYNHYQGYNERYFGSTGFGGFFRALQGLKKKHWMSPGHPGNSCGVKPDPKSPAVPRITKE
jgi:hypothetical protein